jgi:transcriptional regulator with XRE-family HTH domain
MVSMTTKQEDQPQRAAVDLSRQLGLALRDILRERDLRLDDVATALGRSRAYVSTRTSGARDLSLDIVAAAAGLVHLTPHALMLEVTTRAASLAASGGSTAGPQSQGTEDREQ